MFDTAQKTLHQFFKRGCTEGDMLRFDLSDLSQNVPLQSRSPLFIRLLPTAKPEGPWQDRAVVESTLCSRRLA